MRNVGLNTVAIGRATVGGVTYPFVVMAFDNIFRLPFSFRKSLLKVIIARITFNTLLKSFNSFLMSTERHQSSTLTVIALKRI